MAPRGVGRIVAALVLVTALSGTAVAAAPAAFAHPLGNFTVNLYSGIRVEPHAVEIAVVVDRAEIPTLQAFPDAAAGRRPAGADPWRDAQCAQLARQTTVQIDGGRESLIVTSSRLQILPGAAGLATSRLRCLLRTSSSLDVLGRSVSYQAPTTSGRIGWHEVTARGNGTTLTGSDVPTSSVSQELTSYPQDLLTSPLDQRTARFDVRPGSGLVGAAAKSATLGPGPLRGLNQFTNAYTTLVSRTTLTVPFALLAILLSILLGGLHAFAPGHGKTLMAAYLVGREGTWRQAAVIGVSVTATHTIGVLLLGVALSTAALVAPEQAYPWLGLLSGILLAGIGLTLLRSARTAHTHTHTHGPGGHSHGTGGHSHGPSEHSHDLAHSGHAHDLAHSGHAHDLAHSEHTHGTSGQMQVLDTSRAPGTKPDHAQGRVTLPGQRRASGTWRLAAVGLAGGLVPSPSALVVLLGGIALGRAWFGALLVLFYGIGMAAALVGTGLVLVLARNRVQRWYTPRSGQGPSPGHVLALHLTRALPALTAVAVTCVGLWIAVGSLMTI